MVKEIFSLASITTGYITAITYYIPFSFYTSKIINPSISRWVSFIGIFVVTWVVVILIGKLLQKILKISVTLSIVDRVAGGVIGVVKGIIILSIVILFLSAIHFTRDYTLKSFTFKYLITINKTLTGISPLEFIKEMKSGVDINRVISTQVNSKEEISDEDREKLDDIINKGLGNLH